jgi:lysophospholipase L1-like esterase
VLPFGNNAVKSLMLSKQFNGMQIYVQSTILLGKSRAHLNTKIMALNKELEKIADKNALVTYIDLNSRLAKDSLLNSTYSRDDVHLNGAGYAVWKNLIKDHLL